MTKNLISRAPQIITLYWLIKIASTTLGETGADLFSMTLDLGYGASILVFLVAFLVLLTFKIRSGHYAPFIYWATFTASAILGTVTSDYIDRTLGLGYAKSSLALSIFLGLVLTVWYVKEHSLSVEKIYTPAAELFYWAAFLVANTLGTAAGDFLADGLKLGFMQGALLLGGTLILIALLYYFTRTPSIVLFWAAFVLTRPFGATFGDLLTKPEQQGGFDLGTMEASLFFIVILAVALTVEVRRQKSESLTLAG